jgi:hypothetical protein
MIGDLIADPCSENELPAIGKLGVEFTLQA